MAGSAADAGGDAARGVVDPLGYIVRTGLSVIQKDRPKRPTRGQAEILVSAGYTQAAGRGRQIAAAPWFNPSGRAISANQARLEARAIQRAGTPPLVPLPVPAPAPVPQLPTGGDILEDLLRRPDSRIGTGELPRTSQQGRDLLEDILRRNPDVRPPPEPAPSSSKLPRVARVLGRVGGIIGGILYPSDTATDDVLYPPGTAIPLPQPDRPSGPPRRPVINRPPKDRPGLPEPSTGSIPDRTGPQREPVTANPLPVPIVLSPPLDLPRPVVSPRPPTSPLPTATLAGPRPDLLTLPSLSLPSVRPPSVRPAIIQNPLVTASGPNPATGVLSSRAPLTMLQPNPIGSAYREPPSDRCSCPPKQKRKPSKPREVCYSGSYVERSRGIDKQPRRKIPCR